LYKTGNGKVNIKCISGRPNAEAFNQLFRNINLQAKVNKIKKYNLGGYYFIFQLKTTTKVQYPIPDILDGIMNVYKIVKTAQKPNNKHIVNGDAYIEALKNEHIVETSMELGLYIFTMSGGGYQ